ncbi:MAG TPA: c-type cytochrome [Geminicoccus sp.]|uniref:c-type cytochrome n=1 Tax=Geminicoccus sp. TaxID=2024832 RepID=UPI002B79A25B|nr:c-type cytochrome [Geminicoccus sp.]HWL68167.1 c-type cytochrome [Geminicoccus sp.]
MSPLCRLALGCALAVVAAAGIGPAQAEPPPGAASCSGCHGPTGAEGPVPSLQGRPAEDTVAAMAAFRTGQREATVMDRIAKGFTDDEIRAIADWLAAQRAQP